MLSFVVNGLDGPQMSSSHSLLLLEMIFVKDNSLFLPQDFFVNNELNDIINYVATC